MFKVIILIAFVLGAVFATEQTRHHRSRRPGRPRRIQRIPKAGTHYLEGRPFSHFAPQGKYGTYAIYKSDFREKDTAIKKLNRYIRQQNQYIRQMNKEIRAMNNEGLPSYLDYLPYTCSL